MLSKLSKLSEKFNVRFVQPDSYAITLIASLVVWALDRLAYHATLNQTQLYFD